MFGNVIQDWDDSSKLMLINKAYNALNKGGKIIIYDFFYEN
jgi:hypothetical protein